MDGKLHDVHALDLLCRNPAPSTSWIATMSISGGFTSCIWPALSSSREPKSNMDFHRVYSAQTDRSTGIICDQTIALDGFYTKQDYPAHLCRVRFKDPGPARHWSSSPTR